MSRDIDEVLLPSRMCSPENENHERLVVDRSNHLVGEGFPSFTLVRSCNSGSHGQRGVEEEYAAPCPCRQISVVRYGNVEIGMELFEDVHQ